MQFWTLEQEKQVGVRVQILLGDPVLERAFRRFGIAFFRRSSVFKGLIQFLTEQKVTGKRCFEIGTWNGLTAAVLSRFFDEVVSVDIAHNAEKFELLEYLGIRNVRCIDILDNQEKAKIAAETHFDFAFLDGNHARDTETDWSITKKGGRVLFDECWPFQSDVWEKVHQLPPEQVTYGGAGLALWDSTNAV